MYDDRDMLVVLGRSRMKLDIDYYFQFQTNCGIGICSNRNTDEAPLPSETDGRKVYYISCIGSPRSYLTKVATLDSLGYTNWVDYDLTTNQIHIYGGKGNLIFPNTFISLSAKLHRHCLIMPNTTIHHDCILGDGSNIASGVVLNGGVILDGNCFIGANTVIKEGVRICKNVLVGACSFINQDITEPGTYVGSPARRIKWKT